MHARSRSRIECLVAVGAALWLAVAALGGPAAADEAQFPKGLRIGFVPPPGLTTSNTFSGFEDAERKVAMAVAELPPQAFYPLQTEIFKESKGIVVDTRELFPFAAGVGFLATGHQEIEGTTFRKWLLVGSGPDFTAVVQAQVPESALTQYPDSAIRDALKTVTFRPPPVEEQLSVMPFRLSELAGFRVERVVPEGIVILTDGDDQASDRSHLMVMVGPGGPEQASDQGVFAQRMLATIPGLADMKLTGSEPMRINGRPGYEVRAHARDAVTGTDLHVIQWLRFGGGGFLRVIGIASEQNWAQVYPRFRAIRDGIELR